MDHAVKAAIEPWVEAYNHTVSEDGGLVVFPALDPMPVALAREILKLLEPGTDD